MNSGYSLKDLNHCPGLNTKKEGPQTQDYVLRLPWNLVTCWVHITLEQWSSIRGHFTPPGDTWKCLDTFVVATLEGRRCYQQEVRAVAKHPTMHRAAPTPRVTHPKMSRLGIVPRLGSPVLRGYKQGNQSKGS